MTPENLPFSSKTIRPITATALHGIAFRDDRLFAIDAKSGYLYRIDRTTGHTTVVNSHRWQEFVGTTGLAIDGENQLWFTTRENVYFCSLDDFTPKFFTRLPYAANGIAVQGDTLYVSSQRAGQIFIFDRQSGKEITRFYAPGIGVENLTVRGEELWVSDTIEQTVYCLDRATGEPIFSVLTPFETPTGLAFSVDPETGRDTLYVAYAFQEPFIRDNPNSEQNYELHYRPRTFIHPLYFHYDPEKRFALSNGYLIELSYVEELEPLYSIELKDLEWRIALPLETPRQKIHSVEAVGLPFVEEVQNGQRVAVFKFDRLTGKERCIFGWKVVLEVWGIKYKITPLDCENPPELPEGFDQKYLVDNDDLAMDTEIIQRAAEEAIGRETNLLRKVYSIRNYVYDRLSYGIKPHIDTPDIALRRGVGSCGEYVGLLLALCRLNGIACRTVGRYKCPPHPLERGLPLEPDYNHVWMEFYLPGIGWVPMESNPDDVFEGGPYPDRFFMGLAWYHTEIAKDIPFECLVSEGQPVPKTRVSIGDLALNHVQFVILDELEPKG
ncbi:transglutaminase domain-containing protein [Pannus brasiliensis CCIBt3594]|uniref:Transglutaminase domain-containing protein n=1 Tax=Pannus brasiliensis CCIBt3594 TaxID=1427578 RepID=A0AAW9QXJ7_9CHRO